MPEPVTNYFKNWRAKNPHKWHLTQLRWYYKRKKRLLAGWRIGSEEALKDFESYEQNRHQREIARILKQIDKQNGT